MPDHFDRDRDDCIANFQSSPLVPKVINNKNYCTKDIVYKTKPDNKVELLYGSKMANNFCLVDDDLVREGIFSGGLLDRVDLRTDLLLVLVPLLLQVFFAVLVVYLFANKFDNLQDSVNIMSGTLNELTGGFNELTGKFGKESAKSFTVTLYLRDKKEGNRIGNDGRHYICHGMITMIKGQYFILTAAHSVLGIIDEYPEVSLEGKFRSGGKFFCKDLKPFILPQYLINGTQDIGAIRATIKFSCYIFEKQLDIDRTDIYETEFFGRALDFNIKGNAIMNDKHRVRLNASSKPGCSGTPLFSSTGKLISVLHGDGKHRSKHSGNVADGVSTFVYTDLVRSSGHYIALDSLYTRCFCWLEYLSLEEMKSSSRQIQITNEVTTSSLESGYDIQVRVVEERQRGLGELPNRMKAAATTLGYTNLIWDQKSDPHTFKKSWEDLTDKEQKAAKVFDYDEEHWGKNNDYVQKLDLPASVGAEVKCECEDDHGGVEELIRTTDRNGIVWFKNIPSSNFTLTFTARKINPFVPKTEVIQVDQLNEFHKCEIILSSTDPAIDRISASRNTLDEDMHEPSKNAMQFYEAALSFARNSGDDKLFKEFVSSFHLRGFFTVEGICQKMVEHKKKSSTIDQDDLLAPDLTNTLSSDSLVAVGSKNVS